MLTDDDTLDHVRLEDLDALDRPVTAEPCEDWSEVADPDPDPDLLRDMVFVLACMLLFFLFASGCAAIALHAWESGRAAAAVEASLFR